MIIDPKFIMLKSRQPGFTTMVGSIPGSWPDDWKDKYISDWNKAKLNK